MKLQGQSTLIYQIPQPVPVQMMLRPYRHDGQSILKEQFSIQPSVAFTEYIDAYGNQCQRAILPAGDVTITTDVEALVQPYLAPAIPLPAYIPVDELPNEVMMYLLASRYCQSDLIDIQNLAREIVGNSELGYAQVEAIRTWINQSISYQYGTTNATTTALDTAQQRVGVCRDFTHLAIALCRSLSIPARMTVGFLDQLEYMDLHAWFEAYVGNQWYTFDAVQPQTQGCRVVLGYGRDAADVAMVTQFGAANLQSLTVNVQVFQE